jgi:voltage-gated potassium channel
MSMHRRFVVAIALLVGITVVATLGFSLIEGWPLGDSLFMAVITISTVGYGEVHELSRTGRLFTSGLIVVAVITIWYSATSLVAYLLQGAFLPGWRRRRMDRAIRRLNGHYIVCGAGKFGREVAAELAREQVPFVMIDLDPDHCECAGDDSLLFVQGNAEEDETLLAAGVERAAGMVSALPNDDTNVFVVLSARQLNPALKIVSQATERQTIRKLTKVGANSVVSPYRSTGRRLADSLLRPSLTRFLDEVLDRERRSLQIDEVAVPDGSPLAGSTLQDARIGDHVGAMVVAIHTVDAIHGEETGPTADTATPVAGVTVRPGDSLVAVGTDAQLARLREFVNGTA